MTITGTWSDTAISLFQGVHSKQGSLVAVAQIVAEIRGGRWRQAVEFIRSSIEAGDEGIAQEAKLGLDAVTWCGTFARREIQGLSTYTGLVVADMDDVHDPEGLRTRLAADPHVLTAFVSPSGEGVKAVVVTTNAVAQRHVQAWRAVDFYLRETYGVAPDVSGKDVSRLCFASWDTEATWRDAPEPLVVPDLVAAPAAPARAWGGELITTGRHDFLVAAIASFARKIPSYPVLKATAHALIANHFKTEGLRPIPETEIDRAITSAIAKYGHHNEIAGEVHGEQIARGMTSAGAVLEPVGVQHPGPFPQHLLELTGVAGDIMQAVLAKVSQPSAFHALVPTLALCGLLAGRKFATPSGLRSNLYGLLMAGSGSGKSAAFNAVGELITLAGIDAKAVGRDSSSDAAIYEALSGSDRFLLMNDEFGETLKRLTNPRDTIAGTVVTALLTLFSSAGSLVQGRKKVGKEPMVLREPHLVLCGGSVAESVWEAFGRSRAMTSGLAARCLVLIDDLPRPRPAATPRSPLPAALVDRLRGLWNQPARRRDGGCEYFGEAQVVPLTTEAQAIEAGLWDLEEAEALRWGGDEGARSICCRLGERIRQLALIRAWSAFPEIPTVRGEDMEWASELVVYTARRFLYEAQFHGTGDQRQELFTRAERIIAKAGPEGLPPSVLKRRLRLPTMREFDQLVEALVGAEAVGLVERETAGRPGVRYVHRSHTPPSLSLLSDESKKVDDATS